MTSHCSRVLEVLAAIYADPYAFCDPQFGVLGWPVVIDVLVFRASAPFVYCTLGCAGICRHGGGWGRFVRFEAVQLLVAVIIRQVL